MVPWNQIFVSFEASDNKDYEKYLQQTVLIRTDLDSLDVSINQIETIQKQLLSSNETSTHLKHMKSSVVVRALMVKKTI